MDIAFVGSTYVDPQSGDAMEAAAVHVRDGRVVQVGRAPDIGLPDGTRMVDVSGTWTLPGLINLHGHFSLDAGISPVESMEAEPLLLTAFRAAGHAREAIQAGVTTVRELGSRAGLAVELREAVQKGYILGPRVYASGLVVTMTGGHGWYMGREADGDEEVRKAVREQVHHGADVIKIMASGGVARGTGERPSAPGLSVAEMRAAVDEAHRAGLRTTAHASTADGARNAVEAGLDCVEHGIVLDDACVAAMKEREVPLVSTLAVHMNLHRVPPGNPITDAYKKRTEGRSQRRRESFQRALAAGIRIGAGSDAGTVLNRHDDFLRELEEMVSLGVSHLDALRAATTWAAGILGVRDLGRLTPGAWGDLIAARSDPRQNVSALRDLVLVAREGAIAFDRRPAQAAEAGSDLPRPARAAVGAAPQSR